MVHKDLSSLLEEKNKEILSSATNWKDSGHDFVEIQIPTKKNGRKKKKVDIKPLPATIPTVEMVGQNNSLEYYLKGHLKAMWNPEEDYSD